MIRQRLIEYVQLLALRLFDKDLVFIRSPWPVSAIHPDRHATVV